jgi:hypothetical protein
LSVGVLVVLWLYGLHTLVTTAANNQTDITKSVANHIEQEGKGKIISRNIPQIESISYICCGEARRLQNLKKIYLTNMCSAPIIAQSIGG